jgi:DNA polymerase III delta prime subunit
MMQHHAYYIEGDTALMPGLVNGIRARERYDAHDPNFYERVYEKFGVDEAQKLRELAELKSTSGKALFILAISSITTEAQQSLLKLFEEPQKGSAFILLVPHGVLLSTIKSRFLEYPYEIEQPVHSLAEAKKFMSASGKERTEIIGAILRDDENIKERIRSFLYGLEIQLSKKMADAKAREGLEDIAKVRDYLRDRSPSLKMLLEHLALSLPTF